MANIYDCDSSVLVEKASEELKKNDKIKAPSWAAFVKTGMHNERPPVRADWWHVRAASVLRQIYRHGPIGVSKLRRKYGGKKNRGYKTEHFYKGSGNIIRKVLQQLEAAGFVRKEEKGVHRGRELTAAGKKFMDGIASKISPVNVQKAEKKAEKKEAEQKKEPKAPEQKEAKKQES